MLYKSLTSLGIGAASVDTRLNQKPYYAGSPVEGVVFIRGGQADQQIDDIYLYLVVHYLKNHKKTSFILHNYQLSRAFTIHKNETKEIPFQIELPLVTPMSTGSYPVYLKTGLDIKMAIDPSDQDMIEVHPHPVVQKCLKQVEESEFILYQIYNQYDSGSKAHPFQQVFQFRPTGRYHGFIDQLNLVFHLSKVKIIMDLEMVRANQSFYTTFAWNPDESSRIYINGRETLSDPTKKLKDVLSRKPG
ncbi:sporulation protein [Thermoactinomyces mirandus]|uniref:Sporulation protein n=1 Tax=Thermoactinomyces mirandus TaxID=2756294 RepID=A0A7W1XT68_9BACL|nr:sporulation protein [Thermoactinomyces mirandus]MBA4602838.1 sporulation protein [Thermoactinomyces mirandus]